MEEPQEDNKSSKREIKNGDQKLVEGAAYTKIFTSKTCPHKGYFLEFELFFPENKHLRRVKYIPDYIQGAKIYQRGSELVYNRLEGDEYNKIRAHGEWKTIEKEAGEKSNPDYKIKTCQRSKNGKEVQYYMVLIIEKYWEKTVTTEMIYKRCFDTNR